MLYLTGAAGKNHDGSERYPSRFVLDVDEKYLDYVRPMNDLLIRNARAYTAHQEQFLPENLEADLFQKGARVRHTYLGEGTILEVDRDHSAYRIQFDGMATPRTISFKVKLWEA